MIIAVWYPQYSKAGPVAESTSRRTKVDETKDLPKHELLALRLTCRHLGYLCGPYITTRIADEIRLNNTATSYLQRAVEHQRHAFLRRILSLRPPVDGPDAAGETALHKAARVGCISSVQSLLYCGADPRLTTPHDWSPLMLAARYGYVEVAVELLRAGAGVNDRGFHGWTPLHLARSFRHAGVVSVLSEAGGDWDVADNDEIKAKEACVGNRWSGWSR